MHRIVIVGGGYAGLYAAWKLEKHLRRNEAEVILIDPRSYMTYQPFLPELAAGSVEARHVAVSYRRHLKRTRIVAGRVTFVDHAHKRVALEHADGTPESLAYDTVVLTAGAVTRTFPVPGVARAAIGFKTIEEAVYVRDTLIGNIEKAASTPPGPARDRLLTVVFVGGGFAGIEAFGELNSMTTALLERYPELTMADTHFHLIEATGRILPEVSERTSTWVRHHLAERGAFVHLHTQVDSAVDGRVVLSDGQVLETELLVWTAGVVANPLVTRHTDLPIDARGRVSVRPDLRVGTPDRIYDGAWAAGDNAAVPDLTGAGVGATPTEPGTTVPNAQHAVRQGKLLAKNIVRALRGGTPEDYRHHNLGSVATLGLGDGVFQSGPIVVTGFPAWLMHRGYHVLAIPSWERTWRVAAGWLSNLAWGRDAIELHEVRAPRSAFEEASAPPPRRLPMAS